MKLFLFGAVFLNIALPFKTGNPFADWGIFIMEMLVLAVVIGVVESVMARLRLVQIPQLLLGATILSAFSMLLIFR